MGAKEKGRKSPGDREVRQRRHERAIEMRSAGLTYRQIGAQLDVAPSTVHRLVKAEIATQRTEWTETREDVRDLDLRKLAWLERGG